MINQTDVDGASMHPIVRQPMPFKPYYESAGITIYNADCKQVLPFLSRVDVLLTDPPYGIDADNRDKEPPPRWFLEAAQDTAQVAILWGGNYYGLPASSCWLVWDKDNGETDFADCELAWTNMHRAVRKFKWRWNGMLQEQAGDKKEPRVHPTQKPTALMRWCLSLVPEAKTVLDPFMGSGTTLVAARLEGRKAIGIEISERYCEAAVKRLAQKTLF